MPSLSSPQPPCCCLCSASGCLGVSGISHRTRFACLGSWLGCRCGSDLVACSQQQPQILQTTISFGDPNRAAHEASRAHRGANNICRPFLLSTISLALNIVLLKSPCGNRATHTGPTKEAGDPQQQFFTGKSTDKPPEQIIDGVIDGACPTWF